MALRVAVGLLLLGVCAAGCGGTSSRDRVDDYVKAVNAAQASAAPAFREANRSYAQFIKHPTSGAEAVRRLRAAEQSIRRTQARVARLPAPAAARRMREQLLRVYRLNAGLAHETVMLARYTPARRRAMRPVQQANRRLSAALARSAAPDEQAAAFADYRRRLAQTTAALRRLKPPPVAAAANHQQIRRLQASGRLAGELRDAVIARDPARTARLVVAFRQVGRVRAGERAVQERELGEYAERRRAIARAVGRLQRERARLDRG